MEIVRRGRMAYEAAWELQRAWHADVAAGTRPDTVILLEHDSVYTAGRRTEAAERPRDPAVPVVDVDRGGKITWHGPGQLVGYPLLRLGQPLDVVGHVRRIEGMIMAVCAEFGLETARVAGRSGVWTADGARKLAAIGIRVARSTTMHGFAINANPDLTAFDAIVACGIADAGVTSLTRELGREVTVAELSPVVAAHLDALVPVGAA